MPPAAEDLTGRTFGRWKVIRRSARRVAGATLWVCVCLDCDDPHEVRATALTRGGSARCRACHARRNNRRATPKTCQTCRREYRGTARQRYCSPECRPSHTHAGD